MKALAVFAQWVFPQFDIARRVFPDKGGHGKGTIGVGAGA